jgi:hypothetical protein
MCGFNLLIVVSIISYFMDKSYLEYAFEFIKVKPIKKFIIQEAVGNCGRSLKNNNPGFANPLLYKRCVCCGNEYNPDSSLNCPVEYAS